VTMLARELQEDGLINYRRGRIEIVDRQRLEQRACECYETARRKLTMSFPRLDIDSANCCRRSNASLLFQHCERPGFQ